MPPSEKPKKTPARDASRAKVAPRGSERQTAKSASQLEKEAEIEEAAAAPERKTSAKPSTAKVPKPGGQPLAERPRKLTPQQQAHLARARRRQLRQRLGLGLIALVVIVAIVVVVQQVVARNAAATQQANQHAAATATAAAKATATESVLAPDVPPAVSGKTVTLPDGLQYIDITVGTGAVVKEGDTIKVQYTGWLQATDVKFDSSYDDNTNGQPTQFKLVGPNDPSGQGVIQGWVDGIAGMKVGGKRRLIIPPALAYGANGSPPQIPPNATLIFDVQVVSIVPASS
jgi:FKBP-type peptidyl-prolyl cis-trans isomerase